MRATSLILTLFLALTGCIAPAEPLPGPPPTAVQVCAGRGGEFRPVCKAQRPICVMPYKDAGTACSDSSQCDGRCVADGPTDGPGQVAGVCETNNDPCGCVTEVVGGVARTICVD